MARYIDADKFIEWMDVGHLVSPAEKRISELQVVKMIELQKTADVAPVVHAKWEFVSKTEWANIYSCSRCGRAIKANGLNDFPYCHCGAKMDGE